MPTSPQPKFLGQYHFAAPQGDELATLGRSSGAVAVLCAAALIGLGIFSGPFLDEAIGTIVLP